MNTVIPNLGKVSVEHRWDNDAKNTKIRVIFSNSVGRFGLEELGGGVEQVLAIALVLLGEPNESGCVFIEEPEAHLHESAQRKLIELVRKYSGDRQIFIATHSHAFINAIPSAHVFRVAPAGSGAMITSCVTKSDQRNLLDELGVQLSHLLQTDCVVWVEGPTDAKLLHHWLKIVDSSLDLHVHYEFAETAGSIIDYIGADLERGEREKVLDLFKVCRHNFLVADRDAGIGAEASKRTVRDLVDTLRPERTWITHGYEIEWYFPEAWIRATWGVDAERAFSGCPNADRPFYEMLQSLDVPGAKSAHKRKVHFAQKAIDADLGDGWFQGEMGAKLREDVEKLARFIREANRLLQRSISQECRECGQTRDTS